MTLEELRESAEQLRGFATWCRNEYADMYVLIERDTEYFDLGAFGECSTSISLEDENYSIDPQEVLDKGGWHPDQFDELADKFDMAAEALEALENPSLDGVLNELVASGNPRDVSLGNMLKVLVHAFDKHMPIPTPGIILGPAIVTPLPASPLPWPGALREDIDYTADDFPLRYQPPPGFAWADGIPQVSHEKAKKVEVSGGTGGHMLLDNRGRVAYSLLADDPMTSGSRWSVWHHERDGIPQAKGFGPGTTPRTLDSLGYVIPEPNTEGTEFGKREYNWIERDEAVREDIFQKLAERATSVPLSTLPVVEIPSPAGEEFAPPAPVS